MTSPIDNKRFYLFLAQAGALWHFLNCELYEISTKSPASVEASTFHNPTNYEIYYF